MLLGFGCEEPADVEDHDEGGEDEEWRGWGLDEVEVPEDEALDCDEAEDEGVGPVAAAPGLEGVEPAGSRCVQPGHVQERPAHSRRGPKCGKAAGAKEPEQSAPKLRKQPAVNRKLQQVLLVKRRSEQRVPPAPVLQRTRAVLHHHVPLLITQHPPHRHIAQDIRHEQERDDIHRVERGRKREVPRAPLRALLVLARLAAVHNILGLLAPLPKEQTQPGTGEKTRLLQELPRGSTRGRPIWHEMASTEKAAHSTLHFRAHECILTGHMQSST